MLIETTSNGKFFGKTGTGPDLTGNPALNTGWFVGYVISKAGTYSFVCLLKGQYLAGKDSRNIIEAILKKTKLISIQMTNCDKKGIQYLSPERKI